MTATTTTQTQGPELAPGVAHPWSQDQAQTCRRLLAVHGQALVRVHVALPDVDPWVMLDVALASGKPVFAWSDGKSGASFLGWGKAANAEFSPGQRFAQARAVCSQWRERQCTGGDPLPRNLPLAWTGFAFHNQPAAPEAGDTPWKHWPAGSLVVPEVLYYRLAPTANRSAKAGVIACTMANVGDDPNAVVAAMATQARHASRQHARAIARHRPQALADARPAHISQPPDTERQRWCALVSQATDTIGAQTLEKVVLARDVSVDAPKGARFDVGATVRQLRHRHDNAFVFCIGGPNRGYFVGATPETLIRLHDGDVVETQVLAGTTRRGQNLAEDDALGRALMESAKDRHEHAVTANAIRQALAPLCRQLDLPNEPRLVRLRRLIHLETPVVGRLHQRQDVLTLVERMHPTPAVGGLPRDPALQWLEAHEGMDRGWYAAPLGWVGAEGDGVFAVAIRSALIHKHRAHTFAGAGIVAASDPEMEWRETGLKLQTAGGALVVGEDR